MADEDREPFLVAGVIGKIADTVIIICLIILGSALPLTFLWVVFIEASTWLRTGSWAAVLVGTVLERATTDMVGLQRIADWLYGLSVLVPLAIGSVAMWVVCALLADYGFGSRK